MGGPKSANVTDKYPIFLRQCFYEKYSRNFPTVHPKPKVLTTDVCELIVFRGAGHVSPTAGRADRLAPHLLSPRHEFPRDGWGGGAARRSSQTPTTLILPQASICFRQNGAPGRPRFRATV